jgi:hypothetical protein
VVELFAPHPAVEADSAKALRISRYFGDEDAPAHVRFSIWAVDAAEAAVSLTEEEAERVAEFLHPPARRRPLLSELRDTLRL